MLNKLIEKKNVIVITFSALFLAQWILTLLFMDREDKVMLLILSAVLPVVIYGWMRLLYIIIGMYAPQSYMRFFIYAFLTMFFAAAVVLTVQFIAGFPDGFAIAFGISEACIIATLDEANKRLR